MKNLILKLLVTVTATSFAAGCFCGCNISADTVTNGSETFTETVAEVASSLSNEELTTSEEITEVMVSEEVSEEVIESSKETSEETTVVSTEETTEAPSEEATEEPSEELPTYTVEDMNATMYAQKAVNVRSGASTDYDKIGGLAKNQEVAVTGKTDNGWYRISYNGTDGFVSASYLGTEKVVESPVEQPPSEQPPSEQPPSEQPPEDSGENEYDLPEGPFLSQSLLDKINAYRAERGVDPVSWDSGKEEEALARATQLYEDSTISHDGMPADACAEVCYRTGAHEDSVAVDGAWRAYMGSEGHCNAIASENASTCVVATYRHKDELFSSGYQYFNVIIFY